MTVNGSPVRKIMFMKKISFLSIALFLSASCADNVYEQQQQVYESALEKIAEGKVNGCDSLLSHTFDTELSALRLLVAASETEIKELDGSYGEELPTMLAGIEHLRDSLFTILDASFRTEKVHFVEKRTLLYAKVADCYGKALSLREVDTIRSLAGRYSSMAYIEGQRVCDPPEDVQSRYYSAKESAAQKYREALERIGRR